MVVGHLLHRGGRVDLARGIDVALIGVFRRDADAADQFDIEPPFLDQIALAVADPIVEPGRERHHDRLQPHRVDAEPTRDAREDRAVGIDHLVDRAGLHAAAAGRAARIGETITRAALDIRLPDLVAVEHHLVAERDGVARAFARAFQAAAAEGLQAEIDRLVGFERKVGGQHHRFETRPDERIEHQFADARQFAQARPQDQRDMQHVAIGIGLGARRETEFAQHLGHDAGDHRAAQIAAHRLRAGNPVVAAGAFHGVEALVDQHDDGVAVIGFEFAAVFLVREPGIARHFANAGEVGAKRIGQGLDRARIGCAITVAHQVGDRLRPRHSETVPASG